jgi:hypothetical protein
MTETKKKTLIAVSASNDSIVKNSELARVFEHLYDTGKERKLGCFHFIFIRGTFNRLILGDGKHVEKDKTKYPINAENQTRFVYPIRDDVRDFLLNPR